MGKILKVLVACEESQAVCTAFRELGHEAYSCDIVDCSGGHPEWHIKGDALAVINGRCEFTTEDGAVHSIDGKWDLLIAHPPCTRLCNSGQRWLYWGDDAYRLKKARDQDEAIRFFMAFVNADCDKIAIENPRGIMSTKYRKPDCVYNPYDFDGETECKTTCLWLKNLAPLRPTQVLPKEKRTQGIWRGHFVVDGVVIKLSWNDPLCVRMRSVTPIGVAKAMAVQWGGV